MKKSIVLLAVITGIIFSACSAKKEANKKELFDTTWELEYITGSRIAFDGLYPEKKPQISFNKETSMVQGTNSCNGYSAKYTLDGNAISFGEPGPTTMMFCEGGGDKAFLNMMKKATSFSTEGDKLTLLSADLPVMRFKKIITE